MPPACPVEGSRWLLLEPLGWKPRGCHRLVRWRSRSLLLDGRDQNYGDATGLSGGGVTLAATRTAGLETARMPRGKPVAAIDQFLLVGVRGELTRNAHALLHFSGSLSSQLC